MAKNILDNINISIVIADIYNAAQKLDVDEFKSHIFIKLNQLINIKNGFWITISEDKITINNENCFLYQLPLSFCENNVEAINQIKNNLEYKVVDQVAPRQTLLNNATLKINTIFLHAVSFQDKDQEDSFNILASHHVRLKHSIQNLIVFFRDSISEPFGHDDIQILHLLMPHIIESHKINIKCSFKRNLNHEKTYKAICAIDGEILESEESFIHILQSYFQYMTNYILPFDCSKLKYPFQHELDKQIHIELKCLNGLIYAEIKKSSPNVKLTKRELEISKLLRNGFNNKKIAQKLNISHFTVNNHLNNIFKKLNVTNRASVVAKLINEKLI